MSHGGERAKRPAPLGVLLQQWRKARSLSHLGLALEASVSPRHVCFIETGRAKPSREMVLQLADALTVPLRERNALLLAAGFAPMFTESSLDDPQLASIRAALDAILAHQEPFPAVVMNRRWDIVGRNEAAARFFETLLEGRSVAGTPNVLRFMFHPDGLRCKVVNWDSVAQSLVQRVHREAVGGVLDEGGESVLKEVLAYPGVPARWNARDLDAPLLPIVPVLFRHRGKAFNYFSTVTVLGTPLDVTLQDIRIECFFPADVATEKLARRRARARK